MMFPAIGIGAQMLTAIFQPPNRMVNTAGKPGDRHLFAVQQSLVAKSTADIGRYHSDVAVRNTKRLGQSSLYAVWELRRADNRQKLEPGIAIADDAATFHREHAMP